MAFDFLECGMLRPKPVEFRRLGFEVVWGTGRKRKKPLLLRGVAFEGGMLKRLPSIDAADDLPLGNGGFDACDRRGMNGIGSFFHDPAHDGGVLHSIFEAGGNAN